MSSTSRGGKRQASDYYITPVDNIVDFLLAWEEDLNDEHEYGADRFHAILDPCAGGDATHYMSYPAAIEQVWDRLGGLAYDAHIRTLDLREDSRAQYKPVDYLDWKCDYHPDLIITNPPFDIAMEVIQKSLALSPRYVVMLLRLNFFGSAKRKTWFQANMPKWCYVHSERMNFMKHLTDGQLKEFGIKNRGTDSIEYMHAVWQPGYHPKFTKLRVI